MPWSHMLGFAVALPLPGADPAGSASSSIATYILGYGPLGVSVLAMAWLYYKGWRLVSPSRETVIRKDAREDLLGERDRVLGERKAAEEQRDEAMRFARDQLVPLLVSFTSATQSLLPLLQDLVSRRERGRLPELTEPDFGAQAEQLRADAAAFPSTDQIRELADRAVRHGGTRTMSLDQIRATAREAVDNSVRMTELLQRLSQLLEEEPGRDAEPEGGAR